MALNVLVSGGNQGLGSEFVKALRELGHNVYLTSSKDVLGAFKWDLKDEISTKNLIQKLKTEKIEIDIFIHCAHVFSDTKLIPLVDSADFKNSLVNNIVPLFELTKFLARSMARKKFGKILYIGSLISQYGGAGKVSYITEKSALDGLVRSFHSEFNEKNISINIIHPNLFISSDISSRVSEDVFVALKEASPSGELLTTKEVLEVAMPLVSIEEKTSGKSIIIDGGIKW